MTISAKTIVTTAEGRAVEFGDFLSKFIVAHPKMSAALALAIGFAVGHVL